MSRLTSLGKDELMTICEGLRYCNNIGRKGGGGDVGRKEKKFRAYETVS